MDIRCKEVSEGSWTTKSRLQPAEANVKLLHMSGL